MVELAIANEPEPEPEPDPAMLAEIADLKSKNEELEDDNLSLTLNLAMVQKDYSEAVDDI